MVGSGTQANDSALFEKGEVRMPGLHGNDQGSSGAHFLMGDMESTGQCRAVDLNTCGIHTGILENLKMLTESPLVDGADDQLC